MRLLFDMPESAAPAFTIFRSPPFSSQKGGLIWPLLGGNIVKICFALAAFAALGAALASPAWSQSPTQPLLAPGFKTTYDQVKQQCHELEAPYKGGMLSGKIPIDDEDITAPMMANETYPTEAEAVVLRGFLGAFSKCEDFQRAFIEKYAPWDLPNANFIADGQKPIYLSLMSKEITYGLANRNLNNIQTEATARRKATWPAGMQSANLQAEIGAAYQAVVVQCDGLYAPFRSGILMGKVPLSNRVQITPQMLMNHAIPDDAEVAQLKSLAVATDQCMALMVAFARTYVPKYMPVLDMERQQMVPVFAGLIAKRMSFGEADQKLYDAGKQISARSKALVAENKRQDTVMAATDSAMTVSTAVAAASAQALNEKCDALYAPIRSGVLGSKIVMSANQPTTPQMLMDHTKPNDAEVTALKDFAAAWDQCSALSVEYARTYDPDTRPEVDRLHDKGSSVFAALIAREISFGEANQKMYDIRKDSSARVAALRAKRAKLQEDGSATQAALQQQSTASTSTTSPQNAAWQDMQQKCGVVINPFHVGILNGKIPMSFHGVTPAMLADTSVPNEAEATALSAYYQALLLCSAYQAHYVRAYMPWFGPVIDHDVDLQRPVFDALIAKKMTYAAAAQKFTDIENQTDAEAKAIKDAHTVNASGGSSLGLQSVFQGLQPRTN